MQRTIRVLLLEDHAAFRQALTRTLEREPDFKVVAQAGTLAEARRRLRMNGVSQIDVAVLDLLLPDGIGMELVGELRETYPDVAVLVVTVVGDREVHNWAAALGADEVVTKDEPFERIVAAIGNLGIRL